MGFFLRYLRVMPWKRLAFSAKWTHQSTGPLCFCRWLTQTTLSLRDIWYIVKVKQVSKSRSRSSNSILSFLHWENHFSKKLTFNQTGACKAQMQSWAELHFKGHMLIIYWMTTIGALVFSPRCPVLIIFIIKHSYQASSCWESATSIPEKKLIQFLFTAPCHGWQIPKTFL